MALVTLDIETPEWALPLLEPADFKGAKGGRSSGKSHFFAELAVEEMVCDPNLSCVCIREIQRSLKFSAKRLVEAKIKELGVSSEFKVLENEIRRNRGQGIMIFQGMQDHTADSIKSLEGFGRAWVEEAQNLSQRSLDFLEPTIREPGAELWFSWNPDQPDDPVERFMVTNSPEKSVVTHSTYLDNPWCPPRSRESARRMERLDPDAYAHIWLGGYNVRSDAVVLSGRYRVDEFEPERNWDGPYFGADWGFSQDPTVLVKCWIGDRRLWVEQEAGGLKWDSDTIEREFRKIPGAAKHVIRADSARPETINELHNRGLNIQAAPQWSGSVEDGIQHLRSYEEIVIHERCARAKEEARLWRYKTDRLTGDPLPKLQPGNDHVWDAVRYALAPLIRQGQDFIFRTR